MKKSDNRTILAKPTHRKEKSIEEILAKTGIRATVVHKQGYSIVKPIKATKKTGVLKQRKARA